MKHDRNSIRSLYVTKGGLRCYLLINSNKVTGEVRKCASFKLTFIKVVEVKNIRG